MKPIIRIILADDHPLILKGIIAELSVIDRYEVISTYSDGQSVLLGILEFDPEIVIIDMQMPKKNGIEILKELKRKQISTKVIILTMYKERYLMKQAMELGASGYLNKDNLTDEILECINKVMRGEIYIGKSMEKGNDIDHIDIPEYECLTRMEKKVFHLVRQSMTSKQIAEELFLSVKTIENHRYNIGKKLKISGGKNDILKFLLKKMNP